MRKSELSPFCIGCIKETERYNESTRLLHDKVTTPCISYKNEPEHAKRMIIECPLLKQQLYNIFKNVDTIKKAMGE
jgi:hypothetical protein